MKTMILRRLALAGMAIAAMGPGLALAGGGYGFSENDPSTKIFVGAASIAAAPLASVGLAAIPMMGGAGLPMLSAGPVFLVEGVSLVGSGVVELAVSSAESSAKYSVKVSEKAAKASGVAVGASVHAIATGAGTILEAGGAVLAFIPAAAGEGLFDQRRLAQ